MSQVISSYNKILIVGSLEVIMDRLTLGVSLSPEDFNNKCTGGECWHCNECREEAVRHDRYCKVGQKLYQKFPELWYENSFGDIWLK